MTQLKQKNQHYIIAEGPYYKAYRDGIVELKANPNRDSEFDTTFDLSKQRNGMDNFVRQFKKFKIGSYIVLYNLTEDSLMQSYRTYNLHSNSLLYYGLKGKPADYICDKCKSKIYWKEKFLECKDCNLIYGYEYDD